MFPGAQVLDRKSDDAYEVAIKVKVGPMSMLYKGTVEIVDRQPEQHRRRCAAKARESRGQGNADAQVHMALTSDNGKTRGTIDTDVKLSGKAAAMGGGVIKEVSGKLVDQFAKNLARCWARARHRPRSRRPRRRPPPGRRRRPRATAADPPRRRPQPAPAAAGPATPTAAAGRARGARRREPRRPDDRGPPARPEGPGRGSAC